MFSGITNQFTNLVGAVKGGADEDVPGPPEGAAADAGVASAPVAEAGPSGVAGAAAAAGGNGGGEGLAEGEEGKSGWLGSAKGWLGNASIPSMPAMPSMPSMPAMPAMPAMPSMPSIPGLRKSEGGEEGGVPVEGAAGGGIAGGVSGDEEDKSRYISATEGADSLPLSGAGTPTGDEGQIGQVTTKVTQQAKHFGSFLSSAISKAGTKIKETVKDNTILETFNKEQEAFIKSQGGAGGAGGAPWIGHPNEARIKEEILNLSQDRRNFVRAPPAGVEFDFNYQTAYPTAIAIMAEDKALEAMRFDLVPKIIVEEEFWRNYFYRVSLIIQAAELGTLGADGVGQASSGEDVKNNKRNETAAKQNVSEIQSVQPKLVLKTGDVKAQNKLADTDSEFVSDAFQMTHVSSDLAEVMDNMRKLGIDSMIPEPEPKPEPEHEPATQTAGIDGEEQWEKDLEAELNDYEMIEKNGVGGGGGSGGTTGGGGGGSGNGNPIDVDDDVDLATIPSGGRTRTRNNDFEEYADLLEDTDDLK